MKISGKEFKKALQMAEMTQEKAAEKLGVARQTVNTWVKSAELSPIVLDKIKTTLHIDLTVEKDNGLSQKSNIAPSDNINPKEIKGEQRPFSDIGKLNTGIPYLEKTEFPVDNKDIPDGGVSQWQQLYYNQRKKEDNLNKQIILLYKEIELLNQLIQQ